MEICKNSHHVFRIVYHFVWIPKYRKRVFVEPYRAFLKAVIEKICYEYDIDLLELEIPEDHVHMIITTEPRKSPSDIMQVIKSISAKEFFKHYPEVKKKYFWGGKLWTQSYFVETAGNVNEKIIREYVKNQLNEMDKKENKLQQSLF
jgi:putative transposase